MDPPTHPAAQIHQGGGEQVTRNCQRQELGNLQPAASWKVAAGRQPAIGRTQAGPQHPNANQQQQGVLDLFTATGAKGQQASPATATRHQHQRRQGQQGQQADQHHPNAQKGTLGCQGALEHHVLSITF